MARRKPNRFEDEFFSLSKRILSVIFDKRYAEAKLLIDKEQARFPARHAHRFMSLSAVLLRRSGEVDESIALLRQALREKPTWLPHLFELAVLLMDVERWDEAEVLLKEIVALSLAKSEFYFLDESRYRRAVCLIGWDVQRSSSERGRRFLREHASSSATSIVKLTNFWGDVPGRFRPAVMSNRS
jgi:tetratricopeptide (TPR) repeat protein